MPYAPYAVSSMYVSTCANPYMLVSDVCDQPSMAQGVERFFKAAIVDRTPSISSAALVSAYHLFPNAKDVVKRWANEAQAAVNAKSSASFFGSSSASSYLGFGSSSSGNSGYQPMPSTSYI